MAVTKIKPIKSTLSKALDYIQNPDKTDGQMLVSSFGCSYETADIEFEYTLSQALQKGNNLAFHLIQSFEPGEVDYQKAHEIGKQLADAVTKGQHEYVLTTHIDKGHVHNHIIFCAVNFVDHHKYNSNKRSYYGIRNMSDKLCRENGLSVVVPGKGSKGKTAGAGADDPVPLFELMVRMLAHYPSRLSNIAQVVHRLRRESKDDETVMPPEFLKIWASFEPVLREMQL